jgi:hypothetical protein
MQKLNLLVPLVKHVNKVKMEKLRDGTKILIFEYQKKPKNERGYRDNDL